MSFDLADIPEGGSVTAIEASTPSGTRTVQPSRQPEEPTK
jgi:hypothetical protein